MHESFSAVANSFSQKADIPETAYCMGHWMRIALVLTEGDIINQAKLSALLSVVYVYTCITIDNRDY